MQFIIQGRPISWNAQANFRTFCN